MKDKMVERGITNAHMRINDLVEVVNDVDKRLGDLAGVVDNRHIARGERLKDIEDTIGRIVDHVARLTEGGRLDKLEERLTEMEAEGEANCRTHTLIYKRLTEVEADVSGVVDYIGTVGERKNADDPIKTGPYSGGFPVQQWWYGRGAQQGELDGPYHITPWGLVPVY